MSANDRTNIDQPGVRQRFVDAIKYRGFRTAEQILAFFNSTADEIIYWLQYREGRRFVSARLGISNEWLSTGTDKMIVIDQKTWEARRQREGFVFLSGPMQLPLPLLLTYSAPQTQALLPSNRLSAKEQETIDNLWDPKHEGRDLLLLQDIAEGKPSYGWRHSCQMTVISAARLGLYLAIDHDNGLATRDDVKDAVKELRWHEFEGLTQLTGTAPATPEGILEEYDNVIHICERIVNRVADSLEIKLADMEPKAPLSDWLTRAQPQHHKTAVL